MLTTEEVMRRLADHEADDQLSTWWDFASEVGEHIERTRKGHYVSPGAIEPVHFLESNLGLPWLVGQVIKYSIRLPNSTNSIMDVYKAAHYLSRIWKKCLQIREDPVKIPPRAKKGD